MQTTLFRPLPSLGFIVFALFHVACENKQDEQTRPNILLVMADDMGYSDISCYGGEMRTPNLDDLAKDGLRFTQFYNGARSCPTRASLLTGLYAHQTGIGHMVGTSSDQPGYTGIMNSHCVTMATVLRSAGYATYMTGKWHVSRSTDTADTHNWPLQRGFDKYFGTITGAGSFFDPHTLTYNNTPIESPADYYYTDAISDSASAFITTHLQEQENPFFLYVAYTAPHWPLHAPESAIEEYKGRFEAGWDHLRRQRIKRMKQMGIIQDQWKLSPRDKRIPAWDTISDKAFQQKRMEVYAAQVEIMDRGIGRIVESLRENDQLDNTLILFLSDNGGCAETLSKEAAWVRRFGPETTHDGKEVVFGNSTGRMPGPPDTYQSYGVNWANLSNTPFRLYKHYVHEGGIATPLIVHWPDHIRQPGSLYREPGHIIDIMPTLAQVAGAEYPDSLNNRDILPPEGTSLLPALQGKVIEREEPLFWEHETNKAIRQGKWKLVAKWNGDWELYNLKTDRTERNNLADQYPERVRQMEQMWEEWALRTHVKPRN